MLALLSPVLQAGWAEAAAQGLTVSPLSPRSCSRLQGWPVLSAGAADTVPSQGWWERL